MALSRLALAQRGVPLADAVAGRPRTARRGPPRGRASAAARRTTGPKATGTLVGPFLSPGSLTGSERARLIDGLERAIEGVYTHLPLKRARYGFDPIQRLRILRSQLDELTDDQFHIELADIVTRLRDAHTRYTGPGTLSDKIAALPFLVEMIGSTESPTYVVTRVGAGLDPTFKPGVVLEYWNGVPIDRAVQRHSDEEVGGRPDSERAWAVQSLTLRSLQYGPPPDEHWVVVGYRSVGGDGTPGPTKDIKIPWQVVDPSQIAPLLSGGPTAKLAKALRLNRAVNPAAEAIRRAKMLLFAPQALMGQQSAAPKARTGSKQAPLVAGIIATNLTKTLKVMSIDAPGGPFGYLRIWGFDTDPEPFINELTRLIPLLPDRGLIIDVRGNPGGYIWAAELALQLFTPNAIEPTRFSVLATPFTRGMAVVGSLAEDLAPWRASLEAAVRNGEPYSQPIPITDPDACNELGQQYGGPVLLVGDSTTYSAGDLFSAGFVDNRIGPFLCVGTATGAGGANVWNYGELRQALAGSPVALPTLPDGIDLSFAFRRATRARASEGLPIEDVGIQGTPYAMTRNDLLNGNADLIAKCISVLKQRPFSRLTTTVDRSARTIQVSTVGVDRLDTLIDGHPAATHSIAGNAVVTLSYPAGATRVDLTAFSGAEVRQRRRLNVGQ
jgi:hypothetical protein